MSRSLFYLVSFHICVVLRASCTPLALESECRDTKRPRRGASVRMASGRKITENFAEISTMMLRFDCEMGRTMCVEQTIVHCRRYEMNFKIVIFHQIVRTRSIGQMPTEIGRQYCSCSRRNSNKISISPLFCWPGRFVFNLCEREP